MSQYSDSGHLATDNGDGKQAGTLIAREPDLVNYTSVGAPMMAPVWHEQASGGINLTKVMHSFRRRWMLALFMGLLLAVPAALATWLILPKEFEVQAVLQFRNVDDYLASNGYNDPNVDKQWRETQLYMMRSPLMLTKTLGDPKVASLSLIREADDEPIHFLQKSITAYSPKDSDLAIIRMTEEEPREMVQIIRSLTTKYLEWAEGEAKKNSSEKIRLLSIQVDQTEEDLRTKQNSVVTLKRNMGASDTAAIKNIQFVKTSQLQVAQGNLSETRRMLAQAELERDRIVDKINAIDEGVYPESLLMAEVNKQPEMIDLREQIAELDKLYRNARGVAKYPQSSPQVQRYAAQLKDLMEQKEELANELRKYAIDKVKWGNDGPGTSVPDSRIQQLKTEVEEHLEKIETLETELVGLTKESAELEIEEGEVKRLEKQSADLNEQLFKAIFEGTAPTPVHVLEEAEEPEGSTLLYRVILTTFLSILSFCIGVGGVVMLEYTKQRVSTLNEIGYGGLGIRVLGTVPNLARIASHAKNGDANGSISGILAESIDSVRTMLLSNKRTDAPKVILVTSADEHEGKTTVASHLAASLARAGRRTLLVDGDLRKPGIHQLFDMPLSAGLCEVLRGEAEIEAVVHPAQVEGMWVMLAGQCDQRAIASLAKENAEAVFRTLRADYDFVVVDTGPALTFADTMLMGSHADAAVMAILRDVSQIPKVYEARERLEAIGLPVLGGVVGGMSTGGSRNYAVLN